MGRRYFSGENGAGQQDPALLGKEQRVIYFLLIRDTPSEEVNVLNMFPMRGSRI